jgi:hypothetical protein
VPEKHHLSWYDDDCDDDDDDDDVDEEATAFDDLFTTLWSVI